MRGGKPKFALFPLFSRRERYICPRTHTSSSNQPFCLSPVFQSLAGRVPNPITLFADTVPASFIVRGGYSCRSWFARAICFPSDHHPPSTAESISSHLFFNSSAPVATMASNIHDGVHQCERADDKTDRSATDAAVDRLASHASSSVDQDPPETLLTEKGKQRVGRQNSGCHSKVFIWVRRQPYGTHVLASAE